MDSMILVSNALSTSIRTTCFATPFYRNLYMLAGDNTNLCPIWWSNFPLDDQSDSCEGGLTSSNERKSFGRWFETGNGCGESIKHQVCPDQELCTCLILDALPTTVCGQYDFGAGAKVTFLNIIFLQSSIKLMRLAWGWHVLPFHIIDNP